MCEITCENFYSELPAIERAIKESAFIGIDMEFSKLHENIAKPFTFFDTNGERYKKLRQKVDDITCLQLGLAIFIYDPNNKTFKAYTYSFYTYPQTFYKSDSVVNFETACVEFLCKHQFDFNKLFRSRVPYLTDDQELQMKTEMLKDSFFDDYFETNIKFRSIEEELIEAIGNVSLWYFSAKCEDQTFIEINGCNEPAYIILMQYCLLKRFKNISIEKVEFGLNLTKVEANENSETLRKQIYENLKINLLNKMMGIKYILNLISSLKKPLIGHNCALDILILCNQFFKPLPENFKDYQYFLSHNFGPIYDTKFLCKEVKRMMPRDDVWNGSSLSELHHYLKCGYAKTYSDSLCIQLVGIEEPDVMKWHDAGWDAYYTGYCFLKMMHIIKNISSNIETINQSYTITELMKSVEFSKNKLYTYRSASSSIDLESEERSHNQINFIIIQNKGLFYRAIDLQKLNHDLKQLCNFDVQLLSRYTALIALPYINNRIINSLNSKYRVENYLHYQDRKRKQRMVSLSCIILSASIIIYLKK